MREPTPKTIHLKDYTPPAFLVTHVELDVDIREDHALVRARLQVKRNQGSGPLVLDGDELQLVEPRLQRGLPGEPAQVVHVAMPRDRVRPGQGAATVGERASRPVQPQERLLREVLDDLWARPHPLEKAANARLETAKYLRERGVVAARIAIHRLIELSEPR